MTPDLLRRADGTRATLAKFRGKPFDWARGMHCAALLRFHLKKMGHPVPPLPPLRSAVGARRALDGFGVADMAALCAGPLKLEPIAPAAMLMGDLAIGGSADGIGGVLICAGPHKIFGWSEEVPKLVIWDAPFDQFERAFRV